MRIFHLLHVWQISTVLMHKASIDAIFQFPHSWTCQRTQFPKRRNGKHFMTLPREPSFARHARLVSRGDQTEISGLRNEGLQFLSLQKPSQIGSQWRALSHISFSKTSVPSENGRRSHLSNSEDASLWPRMTDTGRHISSCKDLSRTVEWLQKVINLDKPFLICPHS